MLDTTEIIIAGVAVHRVGNKLRDEGVVCSSIELELNPATEAALLSFFFNHFEKAELFKLVHPAGQEQNTVHAITKRIFDGKSLIQESAKAAKHLYDVSDHPRVKPGDLYVARFKGVRYEGAVSEAIGVFKAETTDTFLRVAISGADTSISANTGTNVKTFDKGALILRRQKEDGYRVLSGVSDNRDAAFWTERFLKLAAVATDRAYTRTYLDICRSYSSNFDESSEPGAKVAFLDRAYRFFAEGEEFDRAEFSKVLGTDEEAERFKAHQTKYEEQKGVAVPDHFAISTAVVKAQRGKFKSVIYLDDHAELKLDASVLNASPSVVEKGFDGKRRQHFYKIYFTEEH